MILSGAVIGVLATSVPWAVESAAIHSDLWLTLPLFGLALLAAVAEERRAPPARAWRWTAGAAAIAALAIGLANIGTLAFELGGDGSVDGSLIGGLLADQARRWIAAYCAVVAGAGLVGAGAFLYSRGDPRKNADEDSRKQEAIDTDH